MSTVNKDREIAANVVSKLFAGMGGKYAFCADSGRWYHLTNNVFNPNFNRNYEALQEEYEAILKGDSFTKIKDAVIRHLCPGNGGLVEGIRSNINQINYIQNKNPPKSQRDRTEEDIMRDLAYRLSTFLATFRFALSHPLMMAIVNTSVNRYEYQHLSETLKVFGSELKALDLDTHDLKGSIKTAILLFEAYMHNNSFLAKFNSNGYTSRFKEMYEKDYLAFLKSIEGVY